jgi:Asp-tRNA(Asn)/Glu-tRNA(Gln) amidotransferase C subunit
MAKLFLNSLSGKVIQNIIMETTTIENIWNIEKILKNVENKKYKSVDINNRIGDKVAVTVEINEDEALKNAPKKDSDYFRIPKVLDK